MIGILAFRPAYFDAQFFCSPVILGAFSQKGNAVKIAGHRPMMGVPRDVHDERWKSP
jgi:hypothetical protein